MWYTAPTVSHRKSWGIPNARIGEIFRDNGVISNSKPSFREILEVIKKLASVRENWESRENLGGKELCMMMARL